MGHSNSKGKKISSEDLQFLLKNTNHSKEEIMVLDRITFTSVPTDLNINPFSLRGLPKYSAAACKGIASLVSKLRVLANGKQIKIECRMSVVWKLK